MHPGQKHRLPENPHSQNNPPQVGFSDKLRLMAVLMDELKTVKELAIRGCRHAGGV